MFFVDWMLDAAKIGLQFRVYCSLHSLESQIYNQIKEMSNAEYFKRQFAFHKSALTEEEEAEAKKGEYFRNQLAHSAHVELLCRERDEILTVAEGKIVESERKKYLDFLKKNYKYKIPSQLLSRKVLKQKVRELKKVQVEKVQKEKKDKKKKKEPESEQKKVPKTAKIQKKGNEKSKPKKGEKGKKEQIKEEKVQQKIDVVNEGSEDILSQIDLINDDLSPLQDEFDD